MSNQGFNYKKLLLSILIVVFILSIAFLIVHGILTGSIVNYWKNFCQIIAPITTGFVIAYLSNSIVTFFEKRVFKWIHNFKIKRFISILVTMLLILLFIALILLILVPSLINTLVSFWETYVVNYENSIHNLVNTLNNTLDRFKFIDSSKRLNPDQIVSWIQTKFPWIENVASGDLSALLPNVSNSISHNISAIFEYALSFGNSIINIIKNFVLGIFIAFYMLMSKEKTKAYIKRLLNGFLTPQNANAVVRFGKLLDRSFGGFIEGQLLDAIVVGVVSYLVFLIFGLPIPHLLSTIIAVTNVIPILGPFIGGIPAAFLVLLTAPEKTILFILLILIIQQIDGNIICPHIIGDKIQISSLATIIAIIMMGGLFGILGMFIGVPIFAVVIHIINDYTINSLHKKGLSSSLNDYHEGEPTQIENNSFSIQRKTKSFFKSSKSKNNNVNTQEK